MKYDFINVADRAGCTAVKIDTHEIKRDLGMNLYEDSIPMWIADMDFSCAPEIVEGIQARVARATFGYSGFSDEYYQTLCDWYRKRLGMKFSSEQILFSYGTLFAIRDVVRAFTDKGEGVIIQPPVYYPFRNIISECEREVVDNHLIMDSVNRYSIDFEDFERKCKDPKNKLFILCNPHNPIGQIWSLKDVQRMLDICLENNVLMFSDEVHSDIIREDATFNSTLNLNSERGVIVATAANKTFNLAELHVTNLIIPDEQVRKTLNAYRGGPVVISPISEAASIAAYGKCEDWVNEMNRTLDANIHYMDAFIKENLPKVKFNPARGTYLMWLDFRAYGLTERELLTRCSEEAHVILEGGTMFGVNYEGFVRMNIATPMSVIVDAMNRLKKVFG